MLGTALLAAPVVFAATTAEPSPVTLLLQFEEKRSEVMLDAMKQELATIMKDSGYRFDYRLAEDAASGEVYPELIIVKFKGRCTMERIPMPFDERGPFGFTHTVDGEVLPFSVIACERVKSSITPVLSGNGHKDADAVFGRAVGRVLAHELYHIMAKTEKHGTKGVAKPALSAKQLVSNQLEMDRSDLDQIQHH
jgi:hypothetical protein